MTRQHRNRCLGALLALLTLAQIASGCAADEQTEAGSDGTSDGGAATVETDASDDTDTDSAEDGEQAAPTDDTGQPDTESTETTLATDDETEIGALGAPEVALLDPGAEPRTELRISLADGQREVMVMSQTQQIVQTIDGETGPPTEPLTVITTMAVSAASAGPNLLEVSSEVTDVAAGPELDPALAARTEAALDPLVGVTTLAVMDDRGRMLSSEFAGAEGLDPTIVSTLEQMLANNQAANPLPEEAVGLGARWSTTQNLTANGLDVTQTSSYELVSIEGSVVTLAVTIDQRVPGGSVMSLNGVSATVTDWQVDGSGTVVLDLTRMVPTSSIDLTAIQDLDLTVDGQIVNLVQSIDSSAQVTPG